MGEQAQAAETDPAFQCHHGISLYRDCAPCCIEVGDPVPGTGRTSMADLLGLPAAHWMPTSAPGGASATAETPEAAAR